jgi:hypothetical protein
MTAGRKRCATPFWQKYSGIASRDCRVENMALLVAGLIAFWPLNSGSVSQSKVGKELPEKRGKSVLF